MVIIPLIYIEEWKQSKIMKSKKDKSLSYQGYPLPNKVGVDILRVLTFGLKTIVHFLLYYHIILLGN
jgi:hypothetical protein